MPCSVNRQRGPMRLAGIAVHSVADMVRDPHDDDAALRRFVIDEREQIGDVRKAKHAGGGTFDAFDPPPRAARPQSREDIVAIETTIRWGW